VKALEEVRKKYGFQMVGYVLMPEHVHLLIGESKLGIPYCGAEFEVKSVKEAAV
jgi:REP element-mobilizing transposase RayT